tara:strand:+ start:1646 stop:1891 length:246 start_codon:yes stop_codon:yes gene_type:complete
MERKIVEVMERRITEYENDETGANGEVDTPNPDSYARVIKFTFAEANWIVNRIKMLVIKSEDLQERVDYEEQDRFGRVDSV